MVLVVTNFTAPSFEVFVELIRLRFAAGAAGAAPLFFQYESTLGLTSLKLVVIAFDCFEL